MSHSVFQTAQIMPINTQLLPTSTKPLFPAIVIRRPVLRVGGTLRKINVIRASTSPVIDGDAIAGLERCFQATPSVDPPSSSSSTSMSAPVMKGGGKYGAFGAVTLEKSKLNLTQKQTQSSPEVCASLLFLFFYGEKVNKIIDFTSFILPSY